jgi:hypothetical protein
LGFSIAAGNGRLLCRRVPQLPDKACSATRFAANLWGNHPNHDLSS